MERVIDGRGYRRVLERVGPSSRVGIIENKGLYVASIGDAALDAPEYGGGPLAEAVSAAGGKDVFTFSVDDVDRFRQEGLEASHFHEEIAGWRSHLPEGVQDAPNFLVRLFEGRLAKLLPSAFGFLIVFDRGVSDGGQPGSFLLTFRRGKLESFYEPDLEGLDPSNRVSIAAAARQMGIRHAMKVEAMVVCPNEWQALLGEPTERQAWRRFSSALRADKARLVPFRLILSCVIFLKGL